MDDTAVVVGLPEDLHNGFAALANRVDLQISLVVLPALMEAIGYIQRNESSNESEDHSDRIWYGANSVQVSALLSIKIGGCPEDCAYCPQAMR